MKPLILLLLGIMSALAQSCQTTDIPLNASFDGALSENDCTVRDYMRTSSSNFKADALRVTLRERLVLRVRMTSSDVDSYLYLLSDRGALLARNDNSGGGRNAEIWIQLSAGTYTILATTAAGGLGAYQVVTSTRLPKTCAPQELPLTGAAVEGDLTDTDCASVDLGLNASDTTPVDAYSIDVSRASVLDIAMSSSSVVPALSLYDSRGRRVSEASASGMTARLRISVPVGRFTLRAGTARMATGAYRLTAMREDRRVCELVPLVPGETLNGEFTRSDCRLVDMLPFSTWMGPVDQYKLDVKEPSVVKIRMESALLDSFLLVVADGLIIGENDDATAATRDSEIYMSLPPGTYTIWAAENYGGTGRYTIRLDLEKPRPCPAIAVNAPGTVTGTLTKNGCRVLDLSIPSDSVSPAANMTVNVAERVVTTVAATGSGLTPLVDMWVDGLPIGLDGPVRERSVLLAPGSYQVRVSTLNGASGEFSLTASTRPPAPCEASPLAFDELKTGEISVSDCPEAEVLPLFTGTARVDLWKVDVENDGPLRAEVATENAVPYLIVFDADMKGVAVDINLAGSAGARTTWAGRAGTYYVMIGTYSGPAAYTVRVLAESTAAPQ